MNTQVFWGKVTQGKKRGREMGFPTANILLHRMLPEGIYVSRVKLLGKSYNALTFIGAPTTFNEKDIKAEIFILNFNKNIYGTWMTVTMLMKLRDNKKFKSMNDLITQMNKDKKDAEIYLKTYV